MSRSKEELTVLLTALAKRLTEQGPKVREAITLLRIGKAKEALAVLEQLEVERDLRL